MVTMTDLLYTLLMGFGATLGLTWVAQRTPSERTGAAVNAGLAALLGAYLGGRAAYLLVNLTYYGSHPGEALQMPMGGFAWPGALAGGILGLLLYAALTRQSPGPLADDLLPLLVTLAVCGWIGCWLVGCAYGTPVDSWWGVMARDEWGTVTRRWPVQAVGALCSLGVIWLIDQLPPERLPSGALFGLGVLGLSMVNFFMSLVRIDPAPQFNSLRLETWIALIYGALALLVLIMIYVINHRTKNSETKIEPHTPESS